MRESSRTKARRLAIGISESSSARRSRKVMRLRASVSSRRSRSTSPSSPINAWRTRGVISASGTPASETLSSMAEDPAGVDAVLRDAAFRTAHRLVEYAEAARGRGLKVVIAGAGGAAHLPGMVAALTPLPVLGVPVESAALKGMDSLLSIVQMPGGVPVGTLAIGKAGAINAALLAAAILAGQDEALCARLDEWRAKQTGSVAEAPE